MKMMGDEKKWKKMKKVLRLVNSGVINKNNWNWNCLKLSNIVKKIEKEVIA